MEVLLTIFLIISIAYGEYFRRRLNNIEWLLKDLHKPLEEQKAADHNQQVWEAFRNRRQES